MKVCTYCGKILTELNDTNLARHLQKCTRLYASKNKLENQNSITNLLYNSLYNR